MFQCQSAALDELFGNPEECFQRYQTAQILLHTLSQQVNHQQDRALLTKCKNTQVPLSITVSINLLACTNTTVLL